MKTVLVYVTAMFLTGCAALNQFDAIEYSLVNTITTTAEVAKENCNNKDKLFSQVESIYVTSIELKNYASHLPNNEYLQQPTEKLVPVVRELWSKVKNNEPFSVTYCEVKLDIIREISSSTQKVAGHKGQPL